MFMFLALVIIGAIIAAIFYLLTLQNTLKAIRPKNRKMEPGQVWLSIIPFFGLVWNFFMARRISDSIYAELKSRGLHVEHEPTYVFGLVFSVLSCFTPFSSYMGSIGSLISIIAIVFWIIYWTKVNEYKKQIQLLPPNPDEESLIFK